MIMDLDPDQIHCLLLHVIFYPRRSDGDAEILGEHVKYNNDNVTRLHSIAAVSDQLFHNLRCVFSLALYLYISLSLSFSLFWGLNSIAAERDQHFYSLVFSFSSSLSLSLFLSSTLLIVSYTKYYVHLNFGSSFAY